MLSPDTRIARLAARQHGTFSRSQAYDLGLPPHVLRAGVKTGRWDRPYRDVFLIAGAPATYERSVMAALLVADHETAAAAGLTAARIWQLTGVKYKGVRLLVPAERHLVIPGVIVQRTRTATIKDFTHIGSIRITTATRTLIDLAAESSRDELEDILDEALRRGLTTVKRLEARMERLGHGCASIAELRALVEARRGKRPIGSGKQRRVMRLLERSGLPQPEVEFEIYDDDGLFVARADFAFPDHRLAIEFDGLAHASRKRWEADVARQNRLTHAGWRFLRFTSTTVDNNPNSLVRDIEAQLDASVVSRSRIRHSATTERRRR